MYKITVAIENEWHFRKWNILKILKQQQTLNSWHSKGSIKWHHVLLKLNPCPSSSLQKKHNSKAWPVRVSFSKSCFSWSSKENEPDLLILVLPILLQYHQHKNIQIKSLIQIKSDNTLTSKELNASRNSSKSSHVFPHLWNQNDQDEQL